LHVGEIREWFPSVIDIRVPFPFYEVVLPVFDTFVVKNLVHFIEVFFLKLHMPKNIIMDNENEVARLKDVIAKVDEER
jgi:hypothetical protein